ncbi:GNAT family N-acetyltransferase [Williamsia phyllosphaerae]|uniref:Lysine N-acyltransferase MbtK n=1 Tax=Williamsia phyllosphaerae TaxID=885042 RepID=A0ABQ1V1S2_9NOCA|nr:GNAT family N-acetyltransferase [Williamsia phyllosphaerae]GGF33592.1 aminoglycoside N(6')-acetyltransferase [Williamsia phyllosphaerae]
MVIAHPDIGFRPLTRDDFELLARWLATPDVARWWHQEFDGAALERDFGPGIDGAEPGDNLVVLVAGTPVGLVQRCRIADYPEYLHEFEPVIGAVPPTAYTIDYLIGVPELIGRGLGPVIIASVSADTFDRYGDAQTLLVPVVAANRRSWRALEKAGFRIVASGDLVPDNPIDDPAHHILQLDRPADASS